MEINSTPKPPSLPEPTAPVVVQTSPHSLPSKHRRLHSLILVLAILLGVVGGIITVIAILGGLLVGSLATGCNHRAAQVRQVDQTLSRRLQQQTIQSVSPSIRSTSNPDCVDGGNVSVQATYAFAGTVEQANTAVAAAFHVDVARITSTLKPDADPSSSYADAEHEGAVSGSIPTPNPETYLVTYVLAQPFACPVSQTDPVCRETHAAYLSYGLSTHTISAIQIEANQEVN